MGLTRIAISRPLAMLMFILALVIMGAVSFTLLRVDRMPAISFPFVGVSVSYSGASPQDIEDLVVRPIEQTLSGISGIDSLSSDSNQGRGSVRIQFVEGWDADKGAIDVERRLAGILSRLPADASTPTVNKADPNSFPLMNISLVGQLPLDQMYDLANNVVAPRLQSVPGVADVSIGGGLVREVRVRVNYTKLEAYGISPTTIQTAITRENINTPGGSVQQGRQTINLRAQGLFQSSDELGDLIVSNTTNGPIRLRDVATITEAFKDKTSYQRLNGQESVGISITKTSESNSLEVADNIRTAMASTEKSLPSGAKLTVSNDSSVFTKRALEAIQKDLGMAVVLCGLVLLVFLHAWRNTLIVLLAIPTSMITTFLVMYATGMTLNSISMMALALTIGILVDDSIVVLENIHRHIRMGEPRREAALKGRSEIGLAAMAITMTDVVVYLPVAFMQGMVGKLFREYGLTIASATLISLFVSFTLTPMLASRWMKEHEEDDRPSRWNPLGWFPAWWERNYSRLAHGYGNLLGIVLRARPLVVLIAIAAFAGALAMIPLRIIGVEYAPSMDDNQINVSISLPPGTALETSDAVAKQVEQGVLRMPEVQNIFTTVRGAGGGGFGGGGSSLSVQLVDKSARQRTIYDIQNDIRRLGTSIPDVSVRTSISSSMPMGGGGGGMQIQIMGDSLDQLQKLSKDVEKLARAVPGVVDVRAPDLSGTPELQAVMDRKKMSDLGVTSQQVGQTLRTMISGTVVGQLQPTDKDQMDITLVANDIDRLDLSKLESMPIITTTTSSSASTATGVGATTSTATNSATAGVVRLGQVAKLVRSSSPLTISHQSRQRVLETSATVDGRPLGDVAADLRTAIDKMDKPAGYTILVSGSVRAMDQATGALTSALSLSVLLIYMLLVALYESWLQPFTIMLALPVSLIGAFSGLVLTGNTLNIFSMIGMIMLMGLVAKNSILLVDYTNTLRERGVERKEALMEAGRTRLRPILMTTFTVIFAMLPMALKLESGAESRSPMAVVVIGGVISSTLLSLLLVPCMYTYMDDLQQMLGRPTFLRFWRKRRQMAKYAPTDQA